MNKEFAGAAAQVIPVLVLTKFLTLHRHQPTGKTDTADPGPSE